jgi:coproporphyrinogen III oxidase
MTRIETVAQRFTEIQQTICTVLENADAKGKFGQKHWSKEIGSGITRVLSNGAVIEKGAVNFSFVKGNVTPRMEQFLGEKPGKYAATGISSIHHPFNPWVPIIHMNVRFFELNNGICWFGGGIDLTPHIIDFEDAADFHQTLKEICDHCNTRFYPEFKKCADDYYFLTHRNETRGVGGIFFDFVKPGAENSFETLFDFTVELATTFPVIYAGLMQKNSTKPFTEREKKWQQLRRGRYVEFNLIHDRGTKFGLESGGNTESIMVSLPPEANWEFDYTPPPCGFEEKTMQMLKKDVDWINNKNS